MRATPLQNIQSFEEYQWPDPSIGNYDIYKDLEPFVPEGMKLIVCGPSGVLQNAIDLMGFERLCMMTLELTKLVFDAVGSRLLKYYQICSDYESVGALIVNEDWGFNSQTILPPETLREHVFPWHKKIVSAIHDKQKPAILHSCGNLNSVMDDVILDMEFDGKHSFEDEIVPVEEAYTRWGKDIAILGGGFGTNLIWCLFLGSKNRTIGDFTKRKNTPVFSNYLFSALAGITWYFQFMFYGMGTTQMGEYDFADYPLAEAASRQNIENYAFPDPFAAGRFSSAKHTLAEYKESFGVVADLETSFFETAWYLTGLEKLLVDLMMQPDYINPLPDKICVINTEIGKHLISMGADMIWAGDDFGTQSGMIMDPDVWRDIFKPKIKWMFEQFRQVNPNIKIAWHSCGSIIPIIKDFIEIGLDVLNPIQPLAEGNDPAFLKKEFGKDLIFFGGIDVQHLLPFETPERIKDEVKGRIDILGKNGGYIIAPAHNIQDDTPEENIMAFFEAVKEA